MGVEPLDTRLLGRDPGQRVLRDLELGVVRTQRCPQPLQASHA